MRPNLTFLNKVQQNADRGVKIYGQQEVQIGQGPIKKMLERSTSGPRAKGVLWILVRPKE